MGETYVLFSTLVAGLTVITLLLLRRKSESGATKIPKER